MIRLADFKKPFEEDAAHIGCDLWLAAHVVRVELVAGLQGRGVHEQQYLISYSNILYT